jgi:hypothetical protein
MFTLSVTDGNNRARLNKKKVHLRRMSYENKKTQTNLRHMKTTLHHKKREKRRERNPREQQKAQTTVQVND